MWKTQTYKGRFDIPKMDQWVSTNKLDIFNVKVVLTLEYISRCLFVLDAGAGVNSHSTQQ